MLVDLQTFFAFVAGNELDLCVGEALRCQVGQHLMAEQVRVNRLRRLNSPDRIGKPLLRSGSGISCAPPMPLCRGAPNGLPLSRRKRMLPLLKKPPISCAKRSAIAACSATGEKHDSSPRAGCTFMRHRLSQVLCEALRRTPLGHRSRPHPTRRHAAHAAAAAHAHDTKQQALEIAPHVQGR